LAAPARGRVEIVLITVSISLFCPAVFEDQQEVLALGGIS